MAPRWLLALILVAVAGAYIWRRSESSFSKPTLSTAAANVPETSLSQPPKSNSVDTAQAQEGAPSSQVNTFPVVEKMPKLADVRKEVSADPHHTPPSVIYFSVKLYERMQAALASGEAASTLFSELRECAMADDKATVTSVRALCLVNARRLSAKYPILAGEFHSLQQRADPQSVKIMHGIQD